MLRLRKRWLAVILLAVLIGPVAWTQLFPGESRQYAGVTLDEVSYDEVVFHNSLQDLELAGMLFMPDGDGPFPGAVIIHGSGTSSRQNRWYLTLAKHLQANGIAVLLPDKRGSEKSGGDWRAADFEDLATDTLAALEFARRQPGISVTGIIGMSQGGWIAPIVARDDADLSFIVNMVGSAVSPNEQLLFEEDHNIRQMGFLPGISYAIALASSAHIRHVRMPEFDAAVGDYDPVPLWDIVDVDVLVLFGRDDTNVPSVESAARLNALAKDNIEVRIFDGSGHALQDPIGRGNELIRREALDAIAEFILRSPAGAGSHELEFD
jgi:dienelactone hydrolase